MAADSAPRNIITIDLEEWFHVCGVGGALAPENWDRLPSRVVLTTELVLDLLDRANVRATVFVLGWVAERYPALIERVRAAGHEIGSHGYGHQRVYKLGPQAFRADLRESLRVISGLTGAPVTMFRAPEWSVNDRSLWALQTLVEEDITIDGSMAPVRMVGGASYPRYPYVRQTAAGPITEVPPLVTDRFAQAMPIGWGWALRMSSPRRVLHAIETVNRAGQPAVLTVHPWELDPDPPRVRLPVLLHFGHYFRLSGFLQRLQDILGGTAFGPIGGTAAVSSIS